MSVSQVSVIKTIGPQGRALLQNLEEYRQRRCTSDWSSFSPDDWEVSDQAHIERLIETALEGWQELPTIYGAKYIENTAVAGDQFHSLFSDLGSIQRIGLIATTRFIVFYAELPNDPMLQALRSRAKNDYVVNQLANRWLTFHVQEAYDFMLDSINSGVLLCVSETLGPSRRDDEILALERGEDPCLNSQHSQ